MKCDKAPEVVVSLLNICLDGRDDPNAFGLLRLCAFALQSLSAERGFGAKLNLPLANIANGKRHAQATNGRVIDFVLTSIYTLVFSSQSLIAVCPSFILLISNCSSYIKGLSLVTSTKLLQLFLAFSAPAFILAEEGNPRLVYYLFASCPPLEDS